MEASDSLKVLLVDDMSTTRHFIKYGLESNHPGLKIFEASNGREAQAKLEKEQFDLVLCDWEMPVMTGEELLTWVRTHDTLSKTKFIMITTKSEKESVLRAVQLDVSGYLVKPFTIEGLLQKMADIDNRFDRRKKERVAMSGNVTLTFRDCSATGDLVDISLGGLLATFPRKNILPQILDKITVDVKSVNDKRVAGLEGFIIRIQAANAFLDTEYISVAVKFLEFDAQKTTELKGFVFAFAKDRIASA
jgi:CheY-like chemotaxis protein